jgi:hypothetical protein
MKIKKAKWTNPGAKNCSLQLENCNTQEVEPMKTILSITMLAMLAACSSMPSGGAGGGNFNAQLEETLAAYTALEKQGGAWRDTKDMLDDAQKAMAANDAAKANKLLKQAKDEVEMAKAQFEQQKNATSYLF